MRFLDKIAALTEARYQVVSGHSTIMFFSKAKNYEDALKDLERKQDDDRAEHGYSGDWQSVNDKPDTKIPIIDKKGFATEADAKRTLNSMRGLFYTNNIFQMKIKGGYLFATHEYSRQRISFISKKKDEHDAKRDFYKYLEKAGIKEEGFLQTLENISYKEGVFKTLEAAEEWAYENVNDYAFYALKIGAQGWLFVADIHH